MSEFAEEDVLPDAVSAAFVWGIITAIAGVAATIGAFFMPMSAEYSDTVNLARMQLQMMVLHSGLVLILLSAIIFATDAICRAARGAD